MRALSFGFVLCIALASSCAGIPLPERARQSELSPEDFVAQELISDLPWESSERARDGAILYDAYFNGHNRNLLATPVRTFESYCEGKGGTLAELSPLAVSVETLSHEPVPADIANALHEARASFGTFACKARGELQWAATIEPSALRPSGEAPTWKLRMRLDTLGPDEVAAAERAPEAAPEAAADAARERDVARATVEPSCESGDLAQCAPLERYRSASADAAPRTQTVVELRRSCLRGKRAACGQLGAAYARGEGVTRNLTHAVRWYRRGCAGGDGGSCVQLGAALETGVGVPGNVARARAVYASACRRGDAAACNNLGTLYARGERARVASRGPRAAQQLRRRAAAELERGMRWFERSCDLGLALGCTNAGAAQLGSSYSAPEFDSAAGFFARACQAGDAMGCGALATLLSRGHTRSDNPNEARQLFERACAGGLAAACAGR